MVPRMVGERQTGLRRDCSRSNKLSTGAVSRDSATEEPRCLCSLTYSFAPSRLNCEQNNFGSSKMSRNAARVIVYAVLLSALASVSTGLPANKSSTPAGRPDGRIVFPSDDVDAERYAYKIPACQNSTFCEDVQNYPSDVVEVALQKHKDLKLLSGVDMVTDVLHRVNAVPEETALCDSEEKVVYPKVALSKDMEWLFVVNQGDFMQGVRVEICKNEDNGCGVIDGFAEGYRTVCKQKYIYRQLVAVSARGEIKPEMFRFPASCCCHIRFMEYSYLRIGKKKASPQTKK